MSPLLGPAKLKSKIAAEFPGRSQKSLQVSYCVNFKKRIEKFQDGDVLSAWKQDSDTEIERASKAGFARGIR